MRSHVDMWAAGGVVEDVAARTRTSGRSSQPWSLETSATPCDRTAGILVHVALTGGL
jgi:hypothetical protein